MIPITAGHLMALLALPLLLGGCASSSGLRNGDNPAGRFAPQPFAAWSPKPPLGWNSYDAYHGVITEAQFRVAVDVLAEKLLPHGYEYAVLDFLWYHPGPPGWDPVNHWKTWPVNQERDAVTGLLLPQLRTDAYGRPLPATNRFPSATDGRGLKPLADYVHSKGMKFGLHIMRGIPTQCVEADLPVFGTPYRMKEIAEVSDTSSFVRGMFTGVNVDHPGAQAYYDGLFKMFADWGVDFIKADDMMRPPYHAREIELMRRAIDQCGRPMVFSLSYGEAPVSQAAHVVRHANMWRVSADFWDRWRDLRRSFDLLYWWSPFIGEGTWPDADMIPIGRLMLSGWAKTGAENVASDKGRFERDDLFTPDERQTLMTLWCMARSPLMWGGDPRSSGEYAYALLTNEEVLKVNQQGRNPRQVVGNSHKDDTLRVWVSDAPEGGRYVALFNLRDEEATVTLDLTWEEMRGTWTARNLWTHADEAPVTGKLSRKLAPHASALFKLTREP